MSGTAEYITPENAEVQSPERQNKPDNAESTEDTSALCRWEDDGGVVPWVVPQPNVES